MPANDVLVDGMDLNDHGFELQGIPNMRGWSRQYRTMSPITGPSVLVSEEPRLAPRQLVLSGYMSAPSTAALTTQLNEIENIWSGGEKAVALPELYDGVFHGLLSGIQTGRWPGRDYNQAGIGLCRVSLSILCPDPWRYVTEAEIASVAGSLAALPLGTAPSRRWTVTLALTNATTDPGLEVLGSSGAVVHELQFEGSANGDLVVDMAQSTMVGPLTVADLKPTADFPITLSPHRLGRTPRLRGIAASGPVPDIDAVVASAYLG